jgi:hypothetical protein
MSPAVANNMLELIQNGFVSDLPDIPLYYTLGTDENGLTLYRCFRGTNYTEGGVHRHLIKRLPTSGVSIQHLHTRLMDFILYHNQHVCAHPMSLFDLEIILLYRLALLNFNSTGRPFKGRSSIWVTNELQEMLILLQDVITEPIFLKGWVNGNFYVPTTEVAGILPIPASIREKTGMLPVQKELHSKQRHSFLARMQHTQKPVVPIHTSAEQKNFRDLIIRSSSKGKSDLTSEKAWENITCAWNDHANVHTELSYKVSLF